jgi:cardiolipin synthase
VEVLHDARERLWIASPYFVPDPATRTALAHAALRGVDVRLLLPGKADHTLPWLSAYTFYPQMKEAGVRIWRHGPGFMHQKVMLSDNDLAIVGSINFDYRSFMINFEAAVAVEDRTFAKEVEEMLLNDFSNAKEEDLSLFDEANFFFRLKCRLASLISPEQ